MELSLRSAAPDGAGTSAPLEVCRDRRMTGRITLDNARFIGCRFEAAVLVYSGLGATELSGCSFHDVHFEFAGPAANALALLKAMAQPRSGLRDVVKASFPQIYGH